MTRLPWLLIPVPVALLALATFVVISATGNEAWEDHREIAPIGAFYGTGTAGELPSQVPATVGTPVGELLDIGPPHELTDLIGRRVQLVIDLRTRFHDIAFWTGSPPDDLLVVLARDARTGIERQLGLPSETRFAAVSGGEYVTVSGIVMPVPEPEAMFSWRLTRRDAALLEERGVYVHLDRVVSRAPHVTGGLTAEQVHEWGRETAPPPGEQVETPLGLPPPKP
jgi:hypothetical protein